jgi:hypothetical protein
METNLCDQKTAEIRKGYPGTRNTSRHGKVSKKRASVKLQQKQYYLTEKISPVV